jgi:co-chaperonin GroES (HSP10)
MNIKPPKGKLIYAMLTKQDGLIQLPETAKNRSTASVVMAVNAFHSGINVNDVILHNMKYNGKEKDSMQKAFYHDGELCKVMDVDDVYAKVIGGNIIPLGDWVFCKMIIPESSIEGVFKLSDCNTVQLAACSVLFNPEAPLKIGKKYLISGWDQEMQQFAFGKDHYVFLKEEHLIAEVQ